MNRTDPRRWSAAVALAAALSWGCGAAGGVADGRSLSVALPEAAGEHCPAGGQRILTGIDADGDGQLQAGEVRQVAYVCNRQPPATCTTLEGDVLVRNPFDWANLVQAGCTRITGTLEIAAPGVTTLGAASPLVQVGRLEVWASPALTSLRFPALTTIDDGGILSGFPALTELQLAALARVGTAGLQISGAPLLTALDLPALTAVEGTLGLYENPRVARVGLPALTTVGDSITLVGMPITTLRLPALTTAGGLYVGESPSLVELDLPALTRSGHLIASDDPVLARISAPALASAGTLQALRLPRLAELDLPALAEVTDDLTLQELPLLDVLALGALRTVSFFTLEGAARLPALTLPSLAGAWYFTVGFPAPQAGAGPPGGAALASIDLPSLAAVGWAFSVSGATRLERLEAPLLVSVGGVLSITDNPIFPQCRAEAVLAGLQPPLPAQVTLTGNDPTATCP